MVSRRTAWLGLVPLSLAIGCGSSQHSNGGGAAGGSELSNAGEVNGGSASAGTAPVSAGGANTVGGTDAAAGQTSAAAGETSGGADGETGGEGGMGGAEGGAGGAAEPELCGVLEDSLVIATTRIADVIVGRPYDFSLVPLGGSHEGYSFELVSGTLPSGLHFEPQGGISGTSESAGASSFSVRLTDSAQHSITQDFTIQVSSLPRFSAHYDEGGTLFLDDALHPKAPTLLAKVSYHSSQFSPDRTRFAYIDDGDDAGDQVGQRLYVVRLSGDKPSAPELVAATKEHAIPWRWSPDSKRLGYATDGVYSADVSQDTTRIDLIEAGVWGQTEWLTANTLSWRVIGPSYVIHYATLKGETFGPAQDLSTFSDGLPWQAAGNRIVYPTRAGATWIDFDTGQTKSITGSVRASPGLELVASNSPENETWQVGALLGSSTPLATWPEKAESRFVWHSDGALLALNGRVDIWRRGSSASYRQSVCVEGVDSSLPQRGFSPDGTWVFFSHRRSGGGVALSAIGIGSGQALAAVDIALAYSGDGDDLAYSVSPDSRWLGVSTRDENRFKRLTLVRLGHDSALAPRVLSFDGPQKEVASYSWSPDSSRLDISTSSEGSEQSWVVDLTSETPSPQLVPVAKK